MSTGTRNEAVLHGSNTRYYPSGQVARPPPFCCFFYQLLALDLYWKPTLYPTIRTRALFVAGVVDVVVSLHTLSSNTTIIWTLIFVFEWYVVTCESKRDIEKTCVFIRYWITYWKYANHSTVAGPHDLRGGGRSYVLWPLNEHENRHFDDEWDALTRFERYEANGYRHDLDLLIILC